MFKKIVLFENRPLKAQYKKLKEDSYQVSIQVSSQKYYADEDGKKQRPLLRNPCILVWKTLRAIFSI